MIYYEKIAEYNGDGILSINNRPEIFCRFSVAQSGNGSILLACDIKPDNLSPGTYPCNAIAFHGKTNEGWNVNTEGQLLGIGVSFSSNDEYQHLVFRVKRLNVLLSAYEAPNSICYGITNFEFFGTKIVETKTVETIQYTRSLLKLKLQNKEVQINKKDNYEEIVDHIRSSRDAGVTCELSMKVSEGNLDDSKEMASNLCYLMSIIRGTKVAWIYCTAYSKENIINKVHIDGNTKRYSALPLLFDSWDAGRTVESFLEATYNIFYSRRARFRLEEIIDAYLDAKAEGDFIEMNGAKLAVVMEKLKAIFIESIELIEYNSQSMHFGEYIINPDVFKHYRKKLQKNLVPCLKEMGILDEHIRTKIYKNTICLNRTSFGDLLKGLWAEIDLCLENRDICLFIHSRNSLIHKGKFYCESKEPNEQCEPLASRVEEYFFILNILDRTILKLVGYSGHYINYRDFAKDNNPFEKAKLTYGSSK